MDYNIVSLIADQDISASLVKYVQKITNSTAAGG